MPQAVEHRQDCRSGSDCRPDGRDRLLEVKGLCRQQRGVENPVEVSAVATRTGRRKSPMGLSITSSRSLSAAARAGRTRNVTSALAAARRPPKYPPTAPAPRTRKRAPSKITPLPRPAADQRQPAQHVGGLAELLISRRAHIGGRQRGSWLLATRILAARIRGARGRRVGILQSTAQIGLAQPVSLGKFRQLHRHYREIGSETLAL